MPKTKQLAKKEGVTLPVTQPPLGIENANDIFFNTDLFDQAQKAAELLSKSTMIPDQYRNKMPDCFIALASANRLNVDVFAFMQSSYVVHGRPGMEAKLVIALVNTRGPFDGPIQWKMEGTENDRKCTAYARHAKTKELCEFTVTWEMVVAEGWNKKKGSMESKWTTLPELMFRYRSAAFLARLYCPEVIEGITTVEELQDIQMAVTPDGIYAIESEIAEKANKTPIDINAETGEVVDAEFTDKDQQNLQEAPRPPSEKTEPEKSTQAPAEEKETPEPQEEPATDKEFGAENSIDKALRTAKEEKEQKQAEPKSSPKYVAELNKWLDDVNPEMRYACMEKIKATAFPKLCESDQDKVKIHYDELEGTTQNNPQAAPMPEREF